MREDRAFLYVPKIYLGDIFRFFWGQIKYFPFPLATPILPLVTFLSCINTENSIRTLLHWCIRCKQSIVFKGKLLKQFSDQRKNYFMPIQKQMQLVRYSSDWLLLDFPPNPEVYFPCACTSLGCWVVLRQKEEKWRLFTAWKKLF